jgi:hypothetical protein
MDKDMTKENRRGWVRNHYRRVPISWWRGSRTGPWQRCWLIDVSTSGVSLLVPQGALPEVGQGIEICFLRNRRPLPYRVVRVEPRQGVIGCRIASVENRRGELRDYCPDVGVSWRSGRKGTWHTGWLYDTSASGLALHVRAQPPRAGEEIELAREDTGRRALYRVLRTEVCDGNRTLLACRMVSPESRQAWLPPPVETQSSPRWPPGRIAVKHAA